LSIGEPSYYEIVECAADIIQENALYSKNILWASVRKHINQTKKSELEIGDAHSYIVNLLKQLKDKHSFLSTQKMEADKFRSVPEYPQ